ncbi:signal recognition particle-docking protein FtsY [Limnoraphis robusta Tam1]|uniref:signal recognition particle-docking protein FtsY n=1 Tax=Limnoraphis robusta TaxID=1118279 RepID=UPI002B21DD72|nr:signal recognition particle-docking protein FtsY [Limnoraphis robusta]MEA5500722.1 signal recognition particle-docking protein FtsY [Limnoraphis robusta BA-68 BA1]MEA5541777.1 signal recognition particle-docking protein FtsY [Limnoraphis robusta Tam1]
MVFNWFRRQFDTSGATSKSAEAESPSEEGQAEPQPSESEQSQATTATQAASADDYLQWAKAAYQNLQTQQKQQSQVQDATQQPDDELDSQAIPSASEDILTSVEEAEVEAVAEPATLIEPEIEAGEVEEVEEASEVEEVEETPLTSAPLPIWAQSQAERQARIERLKETAQEEPSPVTTATAPVQAEQSAMTFDEMFIWSAEVLANQGRRPEDVTLEEITWLQKLWRGLGRTRRSLLNQLKAIVGQGPLNQEAVDEIESLLLQADVGVEATDSIVATLQNKIRQEVLPPEQAIAYLKQILRELLERPYQNGYSPGFAPSKEALNIWLITGVNGAGKTTTIGKLSHIAKKSDYNCLIAAADTFRAAAVEQVKIWGERSGVEIIANPGKNTDPAAVVFDAIEAARARNAELLLVDTAGRLQNKKNLMEELSKIRRVIAKKAPDAIVESLLVLDATLGQNGLRQAEVFAEAAQLSGVVLTKLDGTAKGGIALAIVQQLGLPIRFIGVGESIEDLRPFSSYEFIEALLSG